MSAATPQQSPHTTAVNLLRRLLQALQHDYLFWLLLLVLAALSVAQPAAVSHYPGLVDWPTMATLCGLLVLTKGVELSGALHRLGSRLLIRMRNQRALALLLVSATALLATVLTNDVALFVMVPLTLTLAGADAPDNHADRDALPLVRLIIFEALAANAGSALTPIGNPQNLYLWQQSQVSFGAFTLALLPLAVLLLAPLLLLTAVSFSGRAKVSARAAPEATTAVNRPLLLLCLTLYPPFLLLTDMHHAPAALAAVLLIFLVAYRQVVAQIDWALLLVFMLMFIDLRLVAAASPVQALFAGAGLDQASHLYLAALAASQVISNVPATILLAQYSPDWRTLAFGVNAGGAGLAIGSLANIIALRMAPTARAWLVFHYYSVPFLLLTGTAAYAWLRLR